MCLIFDSRDDLVVEDVFPFLNCIFIFNYVCVCARLCMGVCTQMQMHTEPRGVRLKSVTQ